MVKEKSNKKIPEKKARMLNEIINLVNSKNTVIVSSAQNIPSSQLQKIRSKLKEKAIMMVVKKQIMLKAIDETSKTREAIKGLRDHITESSILLFSDLSPFELAAILADNRIAKKAKAGQISPRNIEIEAGPTDIPVGPMISELSSIGLKIAIEGGKIAIKENAIIAKKEEKISGVAASIMIKLGIMPFNIGVEPIAAYDCKIDKIYVGIKIDRKETEKELKEAFSSSRALAFSILYPAKEIIGLILAKAVAQARAVETLANANMPQQPSEPQTQNQGASEAAQT